MMRATQAILLPGTGTLLMHRRATPLNPRKLLHSKWTAVNPQHKEKHFLVTQIIDPEPPGSPVVAIALEAVHSKRAQIIPWRELTDSTRWTRGWS
jgi:tryptophan-rich hypothetical protein